MCTKKSSKVLSKVFGLLLVLSLLGADPLYAGGASISAGGPYEASVGEEIEFDASGSSLPDGSEIGAFYWDWDGDGRFECFNTPTATHTWYSAFSGTVRVYVFYNAWVDAAGATQAQVDWAEAQVTVTGPDTTLVVTLHSDADLHLTAPDGQHAGMNYNTGVYEMEIADASLTFVSNPSAGVNPGGPELRTSPQLALPIYDGGPYEIGMVGLADGPFTLAVQGLVDGALHAEAVVEGHIYDEESITLDVSIQYKDGVLTLAHGGLAYCPELEADPDDIDEAVDPGELCEVAITIRETGGLRPLRSVSLLCSDLDDGIYTIKGSDIRFDQYNFDVEPGGEQVVNMSIPIPEYFIGQATGSIAVSCGGNEVTTIPVAVHRAGLHAPICDAGGPYTGVVGTPITFDASGSYDPDGSIDSYCWDFDLDGTFVCSGDPVCEHTWGSPFSGVVPFRIVDNEGHETTQMVSVTVLGPE